MYLIWRVLRTPWYFLPFFLPSLLPSPSFLFLFLFLQCSSFNCLHNHKPNPPLKKWNSTNRRIKHSFLGIQRRVINSDQISKWKMSTHLTTPFPAPLKSRRVGWTASDLGPALLDSCKWLRNCLLSRSASLGPLLALSLLGIFWMARP